MASGYRHGGVDFDDLFDPDILGNGPAADGYRANGQPLRYAHVQYGQRRADVGYRVGGQDVATMWATKGTATYTMPFHGKGFSSGNQARTNSRDSCNASISLAFQPDGTYAVHSSIAGGGNGGSSLADWGRWLTGSTSPGEYEIQIVAADVGQASFGTTAPGFVSMTSAQSASVTISVPSASAQFLSEAVRVRCLVRRGGLVQESVLIAGVSASGWY